MNVRLGLCAWLMLLALLGAAANAIDSAVSNVGHAYELTEQ